MLPVSCSRRRIAQLDKVVHAIQQQRTRVAARAPGRPVRQVPVSPPPDASAAEVPDPSLNAQAAIAGGAALAWKVAA